MNRRVAIFCVVLLSACTSVTYLSHAELRIEKNGRQIAYAEYHLVGKGGLSLAKWASTKEKISPVIDELLKK